MKKIIIVSAALSSALFISCASPNSRGPQSVVKSPQVLEVEKKLKAREEAMQDQKDRNRVLQKKNQSGSSGIVFNSRPDSKMNSAKRKPAMKNVDVGPVVPAAEVKLSDRDLYAELLKMYDLNNEIAFFSRYQAFMRTYPQSALADDAAYLAGLMSLSNKNYGPSLKYFNLVIQKYPSSNKASSSLFAKGVALKKMNLMSESQQLFVQVQKKYPGSPEALRAEGELKILNR